MTLFLATISFFVRTKDICFLCQYVWHTNDNVNNIATLDAKIIDP